MLETETLKEILKYSIPPGAGALIGYFTNTVAVRMLFRPYTAWKVGPLRVPFTPGVIPRNRETLAESIAGMVSRELIQPEIVNEHLQSPEVQAGLQGAIRNQLDQFLSFVPRQQWPSLPPGKVQAGWRSPAAGAVRRRVIEGLSQGLEEITLGEIQTLGGKMIRGGDVPPGGDVSRGEPLSDKEGEGKGLQGLVSSLIDHPHLFEQPLDSLLPSGWEEALEGLLQQHWTVLLQGWEEWKDRPEVRRDLENRGQRILQASLEQLSGLQRLVIAAGQYDRSLGEKMPQMVEAFIQEADKALRGEKGKKQIIRWIVGQVRDLSRRELGGWLKDGTGRGFLLRTAERLLEKGLEGLSPMTLGELLRRGTGRGAGEHAGEILAYLEGRQGSRQAAAWICRLYRRFNHLSLDQLVVADDGVRNRAARMLLQGTNRILQRNMGPLLGKLDVHTMVVRRINSLETAQVDRLIQVVIARHLKWINLFGALLGFLIGLVQLASMAWF